MEDSEPTPTPPRLVAALYQYLVPLLRLPETARFLGLLLDPDKSRPSAIYDLLSTHNNLGERSLYLNLGYWKDARTYDEACEALAMRVAEVAGLGPEDDALDVGFGHGDQDVAWMRAFAPRSLTGINITRSQVEHARARVAPLGFGDRLLLREGSATAMPFDDGAFDKLLSVEAAFHFVTRDDFFREAYRVLKPGGVMVLADTIPSTTRRRRGRLARAAIDFVARAFWQFPMENQYDRVEYARRLAAAGFEGIEIEDISDHVFAPYKAYARARVDDPLVRAKVNPLVRLVWGLDHKANEGAHRELDYLIVKVRKPTNP